jgi:hypothetical protein
MSYDFLFIVQFLLTILCRPQTQSEIQMRFDRVEIIARLRRNTPVSLKLDRGTEKAISVVSWDQAPPGRGTESYSANADIFTF